MSSAVLSGPTHSRPSRTLREVAASMISAMVLHAEPEAVADHATDPRGLGGGDHAPRVEDAALLHDFHLDDVGGIGADHADQARVVEDRFIGHDRDASAPRAALAPCRRDRRPGPAARTSCRLKGATRRASRMDVSAS